MNLYIDADACPTAIKEIVARAAIRKEIVATFVANKQLNIPESDFIKMRVVDAGPDIADDEIVKLVKKGDIVISEDIPLADRVIDKEAVVITTRGDLYTKENIKERLATRDLLAELRSAGLETGGPSQFNQKSARLFANQLDRLLTKYCKKSPAL